VTGRDYSVALGITVLVSIIIILANLVVDILYGFLDPRTRELRT
jgi:ABC-type dipeptide/oligopeptide/nickel transport system permease component